jgi:hypothetical protein
MRDLPLIYRAREVPGPREDARYRDQDPARSLDPDSKRFWTCDPTVMSSSTSRTRIADFVKRAPMCPASASLKGCWLHRPDRTARLDSIVHHLGLALGGRPAAGFAKRLTLPWRRNHRYASIVCNLERRRIWGTCDCASLACRSSHDRDRRSRQWWRLWRSRGKGPTERNTGRGSLASDGECQSGLP